MLKTLGTRTDQNDKFQNHVILSSGVHYYHVISINGVTLHTRL